MSNQAGDPNSKVQSMPFPFNSLFIAEFYCTLISIHLQWGSNCQFQNSNCYIIYSFSSSQNRIIKIRINSRCIFIVYFCQSTQVYGQHKKQFLSRRNDLIVFGLWMMKHHVKKLKFYFGMRTKTLLVRNTLKLEALFEKGIFKCIPSYLCFRFFAC